MDRIAAWRGYPSSLRLDNGPELVSVAMAQWGEEHGIDLGFTQPGKPTQNSYIERFNRTYREELLDLYIFSRLSEVREITDRWLESRLPLQKAKGAGPCRPAPLAFEQ